MVKEVSYFRREGNILNCALLDVNLGLLEPALEVWLQWTNEMVEKLVAQLIQQVHSDISGGRKEVIGQESRKNEGKVQPQPFSPERLPTGGLPPRNTSTICSL